ncbi:MAG: DUF4129 domain-containing protein [Defluviitaleaceae bacterium]|nr:DUF4129 domain-containing protein [Defluviitaleaceae bacterium]
MRERVFLAFTLFIALTGVLLSMLALDLSAALPPFGIAGLFDGFLLIFNRLFAISEGLQMYVYTPFSIAAHESTHESLMASALVIFSIFFAAISGWVAFSRSKIPAVALTLVAVFVQAHFGVFADAFWNILLFASLGFMFAKTCKQRYIAVLALVAVAGGLWVVAPEQNAALRVFSEAVRDRLNPPISPYEMARLGAFGIEFEPEYLDLRAADVGEDPLHQAPTHDFYVEYDHLPHGAQIGLAALLPSLLPAILFVIILLGIAFIIRFAPPLIKAAKRRKAFDSKEIPDAINAMFIYLLEWLEVMGLKRENVLFSAYTPKLSELVSAEYSEEYAEITALWQRAVYSGRGIGEGERKRARAFLDKTTNMVWASSNLATKAKIKFQHFL